MDEHRENPQNDRKYNKEVIGHPWWSSGKSTSQCRGHGFDPCFPGMILHANEQLSRAPQLLSLSTAATEIHMPRAHALQQEKS